MKLSKKLKLLRKTEGYTQEKFAKMLGCGYSTYQQYELELRKPSAEFMQKLCELHFEYTLWLMTSEVQPPHHISPDMKSDTVSADQTAAAKTD